MRKYMICALLICALFMGSKYVQAAENNSQVENLTLSSDYTEIEGLSDRIVDFVNSIISMDENIGEPISLEDIQFDKSVKIYVDVDLFQYDNTKTSIEKMLDEANYIWEVPIYVGDKTIIANISKGLPFNDNISHLVTDEDIKYLKENEGKWNVTGIRTYPSRIDYMETVLTSARNLSVEALEYTENNKVRFVGGIPNIRIPIAIVYSNEIEYITPLGKPVGLDRESKEITDSLITSYDTLNSNSMYSYDSISKIMRDLPPESPSETSGAEGIQTSNSYFIYIILGIVAIGCILWGIRYKTNPR